MASLWRLGSATASRRPRARARYIVRDDAETPRRSFHSTPRSEIVPFVAAAVAVGLIGRYSFRALKRMDAEREDYQWAMLEYDKSVAKERSSKSAVGPLTLGVDSGTIFWKLSVQRLDGEPEIVEAPERNERLRFAGITVEDADGGHIGPAILDQLYYAPKNSSAPQCKVVLPYAKMVDAADSSARAAAAWISRAFIPAIDRAVERVAERGESRAIRTVLTLPPELYEHHASGVILDRGAGDQESHPLSETVCIPDPVATVWGAKATGLLSPEDDGDVVIIDVGGLATHMSVIGRKATMVTASHTLHDVGGEAVVQRIVELVWEAMAEDLTDTESSLSYLQSDPTTLATVTQHARTAAHGLAANSRQHSTTVHVPYLYMGVRSTAGSANVNPDDFHFTTDLSRAQIFERGGMDAQIKDSFASTLTRVLERSGSTELPSKFLLVGGGARHAVYRDAAIAAVRANVGSHVEIVENAKAPPPSSPFLLIPDSSASQELATLGAATLLPNYAYAATHGLERLEEK